MDNAKAPTPCGHEACNCANAEKVSPYLVAQAERAVVEAAMEYERVRIHTQDASEWNAVKLMLREACAALDRERKGGEMKPKNGDRSWDNSGVFVNGSWKMEQRVCERRVDHDPNRDRTKQPCSRSGSDRRKTHPATPKVKTIEDRIYEEVYRVRMLARDDRYGFRLYLGRLEWNKLRAGDDYRRGVPCSWNPKRGEVGQIFGFDIFLVAAETHLFVATNP